MSDVTPGEESSLSEDSIRTPRTVVLCFDGTSGQYDSTNSNVVKFFGLLRRDCPEQQVIYYQAGIGTYFAPGIVSPLCTWLASLLDEAFAWYLDAHVMGGYKFLMDNYRSGDKVCLFGFSRGAYTARALAGMLTKVGLLPRGNLQQVEFAYKAYKRTDKEGIELAAGFKETFSRDVKVEFIGVWDTVQSTGVLVNRVLPFTESDAAIRVFRHALSLDEHRSRFRPNLYHWSMSDSAKTTSRKVHGVKSTFRRLLKRKNPKAPQHKVAGCGPPSDGGQWNLCGDGVSSNETQPNAELIAEESFPCTDVLEVWFAGCHSDIGGGSVQDDVTVSLAQITLHWMVEQVMQSQCGVLFDDDRLATIGFKSLSHNPPPPVTIDDLSLVVSETGATLEVIDISCSVTQASPNELDQPVPSAKSYLEHADAIAPLFDQLQINKIWWLLEIVPFSYTWQDPDGVWHSKWSINLGRGRVIPFQQPKFHHTVRERMDCEPLKYKPRAIYDHDEVYI